MKPGGAHPRANASADGRYGNGGGFRDGRDQPYRPPAHEMTPREKEEALMAAGRLAAEYFVKRGDLPPDVLENRPPAPLPSHQQPAAPRASFHFQGRPPAPQHRHFQWELRPYAPQRRQPGPRPFRGGGGSGPFPKGARHAAPRPYPYGGARGSAAPKPGYAGKGAAAPVTASKVEEDNGHSAPAGETSDSLPTAQTTTGVSYETRSQETNQPSSSSLGGANDSK